jgi:hypothetical protein
MGAGTRLIFLGGTVGKNDWRDSFIDEAVQRGVERTSLFNPVVANWNEEAAKKEEEVKAAATSFVFYLADPKDGENHVSAYSMVEATMALYDNPDKTVVVFDNDGITGHAAKAMKQTEKVLRTRFPGATILASRADALDWLTGGAKPAAVSAN